MVKIKQKNKMAKENEEKNKKIHKKQEIVESVEEIKPANEDSAEKVKKSEEKKKEPKKEKARDYAKIGAKNAPISTRHSVALCKFIKSKKIERAIQELEEVFSKKRALPMKGEFAHRKGKGMMSGKYPQNSTKYFIKLLKSLQANANAGEVKEAVITEAIANLAPSPRGRFGAYKRKRTHITIIAKNIENKNERKMKSGDSAKGPRSAANTKSGDSA